MGCCYSSLNFDSRHHVSNGKMSLTTIVFLCLGVVYSNSYCVCNAEYCDEVARMVSLYVDELPG